METKRYIDDIKATDLLYLEDTYRSKAEAKVIGLEQSERDESKWALILDQTVFYPQGGGQPYDVGFVRWMNEQGEGAELNVEAVFLGREDSMVRHWVSIVAPMVLPELGQTISMEIDMDNRKMNANYHTAGHLIDLAVATMDGDLKPEGLDRAYKGSHVPENAFVKFDAEVDLRDDSKRLELVDNVNARIAELIREGVEIVSEELSGVDGAPEGKTYREVAFDGYDEYKVGCGGTHVRNTSELPEVVVTQIRSRSKKGTTMKYEVR